EAEQWYRRTLEVQKRLLGPDHLETSTTFQEFSELLRFAGQFDEFLAVRREHLAIVESRSGDDPLGAAMIHGQIGAALSMLGRDAEASEAFRSAISLCRASRKDADFICHSWWRESVIRLGYGLHKPWASESLRWHGCRALDDALRAAPTESFSQ